MNIRTDHLRIPFAFSAALLLLTATVHAHPGHAHEAGDIGWGLAHPFTGVDHLLAAFSVGMLAVLWRRLSLAAVFLAGGLLGGIAGAKMGAFVGLESLIAVSVLVFGLGLAFYRQVKRFRPLAVAAIGAAAHGWAHGSEGASPVDVVGILIGTVAIVSLGAVAALAVRRSPRLIAGLGVAIAVAGTALLASTH